MYQSNIGVKLIPETTTELNRVSELCSVTAVIERIQEDSSKPHQKIVNQKGKYDDSICYSLMLLDTETNSTGKLAKLCQLAEDVSVLHRILFSSRLALSDEIIISRSSLISEKDAAKDMK